MKLYEYWEPEEIAGVIRDVDPGLLSGALPAAFAREMADWQYGESQAIPRRIQPRRWPS